MGTPSLSPRPGGKRKQRELPPMSEVGIDFPANPIGMVKIGRPSEYTPQLGQKICALVASGLTLAAVCRRDDIPVTQACVHKWLLENKWPDFSEAYRRSRVIHLEVMADGLTDLADTSTNLTHQATKLAVNTRQWLLSKLKPEVYGDFVHLYHKTEETKRVEVTLNAPDWLQKALGYDAPNQPVVIDADPQPKAET